MVKRFFQIFRSRYDNKGTRRTGDSNERQLDFEVETLERRAMLSASGLGVSPRDLLAVGNDLYFNYWTEDGNTQLGVANGAGYQTIDGLEGGSVDLLTEFNGDLIFSARAISDNNVPIANPDAVHTAKNTPIDIDVLANDDDVDGDLGTGSIEFLTLPNASQGTVTERTGGSIRFTPAEDFVGNVQSFEYKISDLRGNSDTATVNITVTDEDTTPRAFSDYAATFPGVPVSLDVIGNDFGMSRGTVRVPNPPFSSSGTVQVTGNSVVVTPAEGNESSVSFNYTVEDNDGTERTGFARVEILKAEDLGRELHVVNESTASLVFDKPLPDGVGGTDIRYPAGLTATESHVFYTVVDVFGDDSFWVSDGTAAGTQSIFDLGSTSIGARMGLNSSLFFAYDDGEGTELWTSDGSSFEKFADLNPDGGSSPSNFYQWNGRLYFEAYDGDSRGLWYTTGNNPKRVATDSSGILGHTDTDLIFKRSGNNTGIWRTRTTASSTQLVTDAVSADPFKTTSHNGYLYFASFGPGGSNTGEELWRTDGTAEGTMMVSDINPGSGSSNLSELVAGNDFIFFTADDGEIGQAVWQSDGTAAGTKLLADINPDTGWASISQLETVGNRVYFFGNPAPNGDWAPDLFVANATRPPVRADIGDFVFLDANADGIQGAQEDGIGDVRVRLFGPGEDGEIGGGDDALLATTLTESDGSYVFSDRGEGDYFLRFETPAGYVFSPHDQGGSDRLDSDAKPRASNLRLGDTEVFTVASPGVQSQWDAGLVKAVEIGDRVWLDENENGRQDASEGGVAGIELLLEDDSRTVIASTTTDDNGFYSFTVNPGRYRVTIKPTEDYYLTGKNETGDDVDNDFDVTTKQSPWIEVVSDEPFDNLDAGLIETPEYDTGSIMVVGDFEYVPEDDVFEAAGRVFIGLKPTLENDTFKPLVSVVGVTRYDETTISVDGDVFSNIGSLGEALFAGQMQFSNGGQPQTTNINVLGDPTLHVVGLDVTPSKLVFVNPGDVGVADSFFEIEGEMALNLPEFQFTLPDIAVSLTESSPIIVKDTGLEFQAVALPRAEVELANITLGIANATLSLQKADATDKIVIQGKFEFPDLAGVALDLTGPGNQLEISHNPTTGFNFNAIGKFTFKAIEFPGFGIKDGELQFDVQNREFKGKATVLFGPAREGIELRKGVIGQLGFRQGQLNTIGLGVAGLSVPIGTSAWELNSVFGSFDNFADSDPEPLAIFGELGFTDILPNWRFPIPAALGGGSLLIDLAAAKLNGMIDISGISGSGEINLFHTVSTENGGVEDTSILKVTGMGKLNWENNFLQIDGGVELFSGILLDPLLTGKAKLKVDSKLNVTGKLDGAISFPTSFVEELLPVNLEWLTVNSSVTGTAAVQYFHNGTFADDAISVWGSALGVSAGIRIGFDGSATLLGTRDIRTISASPSSSRSLSAQSFGDLSSLPSFIVDEDADWIVLGADWENPSGQVNTRLIDPQGREIYAEDFGDHDNIRFAPSSRSQNRRVVIVREPDVGNWRMVVDSNQDLGQIEYTGTANTAPPEIRLTNMGTDRVPNANEIVPLRYQAESSTGDAEVRFYFDSDREGFDGVLVDLQEDQDQPDELKDLIPNALETDIGRWDTSGVPEGEYYVYAVIDDGISPIVFSEYSVGKVSIGLGGTVRGKVFKDRNGDGEPNSNEVGVENAEVFLDQNNNGRIDDGELTTQSDSEGNYEFAGVVAGDYRVAVANQNNVVAPVQEYHEVAVSGAESLDGLDFAIANNAAKPDLTISFRDGTTLANKYVPGDRLGVLKTLVENIGNELPNGRTTIDTILSQNDVIGDSDDIVIGTSRRVIRTRPTSDRGRPTPVNVVTKLPTNVGTGTYYVGVRFDNEAVIPELREFNNTAMIPESIEVVTQLGRIGKRNVRRLVLDIGGTPTTFIATGWLGNYQINVGANSFDVESSDTMFTSQLRITSWRNTPVRMSGFSARHEMRGIMARSTNLTGDIQFEQGASRIWLMNVAGESLIEVGQSERTRDFRFRAETVRDLSIYSLEKIRQVFVTSWTDQDDNDDIIAAPDYFKNAIRAREQFEAELRYSNSNSNSN